ncbi:hypothetical protein RvVAR031_20170 [Agrobacterium vitis]|nr:hypothetical protein RvVAR031_20170 [Agrobacterium vitis]
MPEADEAQCQQQDWQIDKAGSHPQQHAEDHKQWCANSPETAITDKEHAQRAYSPPLEATVPDMHDRVPQNQ